MYARRNSTCIVITCFPDTRNFQTIAVDHTAFAAAAEGSRVRGAGMGQGGDTQSRVKPRPPCGRGASQDREEPARAACRHKQNLDRRRGDVGPSNR